MFNLAFWKAATERALKSGAQFAAVVITAGLTGATGNEVVNAFLLDYTTLLGVFAGGVIFSYVTSIASAPVSGGPSITGSELTPDRISEYVAPSAEDEALFASGKTRKVEQ